MLGSDRDNPVAALCGFFDRALEGPVDRLGRASREGDVAAGEPDCTLNLLSGDFDGCVCLATPARRRMRICELVLDPGLHRPRYVRRYGAGRLIIEVDHSASA